MSAAVDEENDEMMCCASCGTAGDGDDIKLMKCTACHLVKYCSVKCQREHRPQHKRACKQRAAELRDEILFKQPECSHLGDCPICCLPLPFKRNILMPCCGKSICNGCDHANKMCERERRLQNKCAFCRQPLPKPGEDPKMIYMKRVEANDPTALSLLGNERCDEGDYKGGLNYFSKAAALGDAVAHYQLFALYQMGEGVEKDEKKQIYHLERAAIGGHSIARHNLGCIEERHGKMDRALKHWIIAANMGYDLSLEALKNAYRKGLVSKEDFAGALRGYQAAIDATKSSQREEAEKFKEFFATKYVRMG